MTTKPLPTTESGFPNPTTECARPIRSGGYSAGRWLLLLLVALIGLAPAASAQPNWVLVWSDEFNGPAGPFTPTSSSNQFWTFETGKGVFGTGEIEDMISDGTTSFLDGNGHLVIKTYLSGGTYFSARMKTQLNGSFGHEFTYGRVEARIQIPTSQAIWPAFWMMGDNGVTWPGRGEIDIMENNGAKPTQIKGTIHGIGYANTGLGVHSNSTTPFTNDYHIYGMIWSPFQIQFYVDDPTNIYATMTPGDIMGVGTNGAASTLGQWDFWGHNFFILFDVAVGGGFVGPPGSGTVVPQVMNIDYVRVFQATPPAGPTALTAAAISNSQAQLSWTASTSTDPNVTYNIFRSTTSGQAHNISNTNMANMIATGVTGTTFNDVMLTPGTTYFYQVDATGQESGESALSNEASVSLPSAGTGVQPIAISSGSLVGTANFVQDTGFGSTGATNAFPDVIDVSGVAHPAPQSVYRTERWGPMTYTIPNLTPGASFTVRLHFAETAFTAAGQRAFNVAINGTQVLSNYDIFADAGAQAKATEKDFTATADGSGTITIAFTAGTNGAPHTNPSLRGIEVIPAGTSCSPPTVPANFTATTASGSEIDLSWTASTGPACGGAVTYKVTRNGAQVASGLSGTSFKDTGLTGSTTYNYTVAAVNSAGSSATASASATTSSCSAPTTPTNFTATAASSSEIDLSWTASTGPACGGAVTYSVTRNGSQIASGQSGTTLKDTGLTASTTYNYAVTAANSGGTSAPATASATTQGGTPVVVQINAGGPAVSPFIADTDFAGGHTINHANTIDLSGVTNPAPMAVYQTARVATSTYTIPGFAAGSSHTVRLHFAETFWTAANSRIFNVSINGTQVLTNFDIFATTGAKNKAVIEQFTANANSSGQYVITFTSVKDLSLISGIEIQ